MDANNKEGSPKEVKDQGEKAENPFVALVTKKIKKASKKLQRITALEAQLKASKAAINEDQKKLLDSKEGTQTLFKEFEELKNQMLKLIQDQSKETTGKGDAEKKPKKPKKKKETKEAVAPAQPTQQAQQTPQVSTPQQPVSAPAPVETPKQEAQPAPAPETKKEQPGETKKEEDKTASITPTQSQEAEGEEGEEEGEGEGEGEFADREAVRKEWAAQKQIYIEKYKATLGSEHENKYIAVHKGILYGPCDNLQQLKEAQGGYKLPGAFLARVGHEDEPPVRKLGGRGSFRGRGGFRGRGSRGGRGAPRGEGRGTSSFRGRQ
jgi:hypothetical protein